MQMKKSEKAEKGRLTVSVSLLLAAESSPGHLRAPARGRAGKGRVGRCLCQGNSNVFCRRPRVLPVAVTFFYYLNCPRNCGMGFNVGRMQNEFYFSQLH